MDGYIPLLVLVPLLPAAFFFGLWCMGRHPYDIYRNIKYWFKDNKVLFVGIIALLALHDLITFYLILTGGR